MMEENFRCNVLILGKTGTGKSSLLNYLCNENLAKTGAGKPVTGEGIYDFVANINGQEVKIYDSWGIEAGKVREWKTLLDEKLKAHGVDKDIKDWFHSVIYCIQAGGGRIEDIDEEIICKFLSEGYRLIVVLTKADQLRNHEAEKDRLIEAIASCVKGMLPASGSKSVLNIVPTCAERKMLRSGESLPFGKEDVQNAIFEGWKDTIIDRLPKHIVARVCNLISDWENNEIAKLDVIEISGSHDKNESIYNTIKQSAKDFQEIINKTELQKIINDALDKCKKANTSLENVFGIPEIPTDQPCNPIIKWWEYVLLTVPRIVDNFIQMIKDLIPSYKDEERKNLESFIKGYADDMRKHACGLETKLSMELNNVL